jgi:hypothetical protein
LFDVFEGMQAPQAFSCLVFSAASVSQRPASHYAWHVRGVLGIGRVAALSCSDDVLKSICCSALPCLAQLRHQAVHSAGLECTLAASVQNLIADSFVRRSKKNTQMKPRIMALWCMMLLLVSSLGVPSAAR